MTQRGAELRIAASLWSVPATQRRDEALRLVAGGIDRFHWDYSDGQFAPSGGTLAIQAAAITASTGARAEAHLMVSEPLAHVDQWAAFCDVIAVHVESHSWQDAIERIIELGRVPGIAISPDTPIPRELPNHVEAMLVMSVPPGMGGTVFDSRTLDRIREVPASARAGIDGAVTSSLAVKARQAGADWIVSGTDLLRAPDPAAWLTHARS